MDLTGKNILILGMGLSGRQACRLALKFAATVYLADSRSEEQVKGQLDQGFFEEAKLELLYGAGEDSLRALSVSFDYIVISPGLSPESEFGRFAQAYSCPVLSELDFASAFIPTPLITVTGTNGKTTTVELLTHLLKSANYKVESAGNIGLALSDIAYDEAYRDLDFVIVEASSYQLENLHFYKSQASALLNISSDHCDRYSGESEYFLTKLKLLDVTEKGKFLIGEKLLSRSDFPRSAEGKILSFRHKDSESLGKSAILLDEDRLELNGDSFVLPADMTESLKAPHNLENLAVALGLANFVGVPVKSLLGALRTFRLSPHRIELFAERSGRSFVDDSKATNPDAVIQALKSFPSHEGKIRLILGGVSKDMDFSTLPESFSVVKKLYFYGRDGEFLERQLAKDFDSIFDEDFKLCVGRALAESDEGDLVLLSPACASFDQFASYEKRGECFKDLCLNYEFISCS